MVWMHERWGLFVGVGALLVFWTGVAAVWLPFAEVSVRRTALLRDARGLEAGAVVRLGGVEVGVVDAVKPVMVDQTCDPEAEDFTRDDCDQEAVCTPEGKCGELATAWLAHNLPCIEDADCGPAQICVTPRLYRSGVRWDGPAGVCSRYQIPYPRARVEMTLGPQTLGLVSVASTVRATAEALDITLAGGASRPMDWPLFEAREVRTDRSPHWDCQYEYDGLFNGQTWVCRADGHGTIALAPPQRVLEARCEVDPLLCRGFRY